MTVPYGQVKDEPYMALGLARVNNGRFAAGMVEALDKLKGRECRRQAILDVAREIFLEDGFAAASMSTIAARVGGSKGTLYNYFPSKEALFAAVIDDWCAQNRALLFDFDPDEQAFTAALQKIGERLVRLMLSDELITLHRLIIAESSRFPEIARILYGAGPRPALAQITVYIRHAMDAGALRQADAARAAEQFMDLCLSGLYRLRLWGVSEMPSDEEVRANIDAAMATFLAAYGAREPEPA